MSKVQQKITRSTAGLRNVAFDTLERFLNGQVDGQHVKAVNSTIATICQTVALDLEAQKMLSAMKKSGELVPPGAPQAVADLNLNLMLTDSVKPDAPAYVPE
jgi:hypothetical protein